jgi:putative ABC transport system permease protein
MILELAWRNIWRNPRRTIVILIAVVMGVWSMVFMGAWLRGMTDQMVGNSIATLTGEIQIHAIGYRNDPVIENSMTAPETVRDVLKKVLPSGAQWSSRIRVNAIAGNARHSTGVTLVGINPTTESNVSFIGSAVTHGRYLLPTDGHGIVVGKALANKFETKLGRKLVLMSQAADKEIASRAFRIVGLFTAELAATEKQFVFVTTAAARQMLKLEKDVSEIAIVLPDRRQSDNTAESLKNALPAGYDVATWKTLLPIVRAYLSMMDAWLFIWYLIVFIAMGFGIVNTLLMAIFERIKEFGLLKALGMKPGRIIGAVLTESLLILILGIAIGNMLGYATVHTLADVGIDLSFFAEGAEFAGISRIIYPALHVRDMFIANLVVFFLGLAVSAYPAVKAARITPVEAFAHT